MLNRTQKAYKQFDYAQAVYWAEQILDHPHATDTHRFSACLWAGAAAYLLGYEDTARWYFSRAHSYAQNPAIPHAWFPNRIVTLFQEAAIKVPSGNLCDCFSLYSTGEER